MASAVMASRNEPYWGENKTYMRNFTDSNNQRFNGNRNQFQNPNTDNAVSNQNSPRLNEEYFTSRGRERDARPDAGGAIIIGGDDSNETSCGAYLTFNQSDYTRDELKELKKRFIAELEQVRTLRRRIQSGRFCSRSGNTGGAAPPVNQHNHSLEVPPAGDTRTNPMPLPKMNQYHQHPDVLNAMNNPKQRSKKSLSGIKRSNSKAPVTGSKRSRVDPGVEKLMNSMKKRCGDILGELMRSKFGWVFNKPVDAAKLGLLDYHLIIKTPMDLGTVKSNLRKGAYATPLDFASDVQLTFNNAMLYNPEGQDVHVMAKGLLSSFNVMFSPMKKRFEDDCRLMMAAEEAQQLYQPQALLSPPSARIVQDVRVFDPVPVVNKSQPIGLQVLPSSPPQEQPMTPLPADFVKPVTDQPNFPPKPKARDLNKREMSYEEKVMLGTNLQNLPSEKMVQLLSIIKRRSGHLDQDGDEIELDIETMDKETLWELDRFVCNVHKISNKLMRQEQGIASNHNSVPEINKLDQSEMLGCGEQKNKKFDAGDEDVDIGEEIPMSHFPPVEIERDDNDGNASSRTNYSGSSSSSSGSSSSCGSDSASSSGSDSDADSIQSPYVELKEVGQDGMTV